MKTFFVLAMELVMFASSQWLAPEPAMTERGTLISRLNRVVVVLSEDEKTTRKYDIMVNTSVMLDGKPAQIEDLQAGDVIVVSLDDKRTVTKVEATSGKRQELAVEISEAEFLSGRTELIARGPNY